MSELIAPLTLRERIGLRLKLLRAISLCADVAAAASRHKAGDAVATPIASIVGAIERVQEKLTEGGK